MTTTTDIDWTVFEALRAARRRERGPFLRAALALGLSEDGPFPSRSHLWLAAELAFVLGRYEVALDRFDAWLMAAEHDPAPPWMHFIAPLHACRSAQRLGRFSVSQDHLRAAEKFATSLQSPALFEGETEALWGHQIEAQGTLEVAKLRFLFAYEQAIRHKNWKAGIEIAYDIGRIQSRLRNWADAHHWLTEAQHLLEHHENALFRRKIEVRLAQLERSARRFESAKSRLKHIIEALTPAKADEPERSFDHTMPDPLMFAYSAMHEMHLLEDDFAGALECLTEAWKLAEPREILPTAVDIQRDMALLHMFWSDTILDSAGLLESHRSVLSQQRLEASRKRRRKRAEKNMIEGTGVPVPEAMTSVITEAQHTAARDAADHRAIARVHFAEALELVGKMSPAPAVRLTAIAVDLRNYPELLNPGPHTEHVRRRIADAHESVKRVRPPALHGQAQRLRARERAAEALAVAIADATDHPILTLWALVRSRSRKIDWLGPARSNCGSLTFDQFTMLKSIAQRGVAGIEREALMAEMAYDEDNRTNFNTQLCKLRAALGGAESILDGTSSTNQPTLRLAESKLEST